MQTLKSKVKEQLAIAEETVVSRILEKILSYAASESIDEIVIEEEGGAVLIRLYDAGEEKGKLSLSEKVGRSIVGSIKGLAGIKDGISPASGQFKKEITGGKTVFSVSVYPGAAAEKIIIMIGKERHWLMELGQLGLEKTVQRRVKEILDKRQGMVLVLGTFNSGKTSSLYSFLNYINRADLNIATVENEVAYDIPWANQSRLNPQDGFSHSLAMSSLLRQDPDVVMIDELSDQEGAEAALRLADRGYFVLAGLYSHNISSCLDFLNGLGVPLKLFTDVVKLVVNQRLAERNCPKCLAKKKVGSDLAKRLGERLDLKSLLKRLKDEKVLPEKIEKLEDISFFEGLGCESCQRTGRSGKIGIFEIMEMNDVAEKLIREGHFAKVRSEIGDQGGLTLPEDAFAKAARGIIPLSEVFKVLEEAGQRR